MAELGHRIEWNGEDFCSVTLPLVSVSTLNIQRALIEESCISAFISKIGEAVGAMWKKSMFYDPQSGKQEII